MQCTLCVHVVDLLCVCYSGTSVHTHKKIVEACQLDIEAINRNGPLTITVDFLIETVHALSFPFI